MNGKWLPGFVPDPDSSILAVHAALLCTAEATNTGSIAFFSGSDYVREEHDAGRVDRTRIFDCDTHTVRNLPSPIDGTRPTEPPDLFCCGHALLGDGRLVVVGGTHIFGLGEGGGFHHNHWPGLDTTFVFDPKSLIWIEADLMPPPPGEGLFTGGRWYPTAVTLPDGGAIAMSGHPDEPDDRHNNNSPGIFKASNPRGSQWRVFPLPSQAFELGVAEQNDREDREYPRAHVIPGGVVFCSTPLAPASSLFATQMQILDPESGARAFVGLSPATARSGQTPSLSGAEEIYRSYFGTSVLLPLLPEHDYRARALLFGGQRAWFVDLAPIASAVLDGTIPWNEERLGSLARATPAPRRTLSGKRHTPPIRKHVNAVILPSGEVFFVGGIDTAPGDVDLDIDAVLSAEIFGPAEHGDVASDSWDWSVVEAESAGTQVVPRNYHSVALLLPDGRVWCAGSSKNHQSDEHERRMQLYEPWYVAESRPVLASSPAVINYGHRFELQVQPDRPIQRVALIRCGSATHGFDSDQRYVGTTFERESNSKLSVLAPPNGGIAPPGMYLIFVIDDHGVPSKGRFTRLEWIPVPASRPSFSSFAVSPSPRYVYVFWVRPDGMVFADARHPQVLGGDWNNPFSIAPNPGSADPRSGVAAVCPAPGIVEVFWVRPDGMVFTNARDPNINGGNWNNPVPIAPNPGSAAIRNV